MANEPGAHESVKPKRDDDLASGPLVPRSQPGTVEDVRKYLDLSISDSDKDPKEKLSGEDVFSSEKSFTRTDVEILEAFLTKLRSESGDGPETEVKIQAAVALLQKMIKEGQNSVGWAKNFLNERREGVESLAERGGIGIEQAKRAVLVGEMAERLSDQVGLFEAKTVFGAEVLDDLVAVAKRVNLEISVVPPQEIFGRKADSEIMGLIFYHLISQSGFAETMEERGHKSEEIRWAAFAEQNVKSPWAEWVRNEEAGKITLTHVAQFKQFLSRLQPPEDKRERENWKSPIRRLDGKFVLDLSPGTDQLPLVQEVLDRLNRTTTVPDGVLVLGGGEVKKGLWPVAKNVGWVEVKAFTIDEWNELNSKGRLNAEGDWELAKDGVHRLGLAVSTQRKWYENLLPEGERSKRPFYLLRVLAETPRSVSSIVLNEEAERGVRPIVQELPLSRGDMDFLIDEMLKVRKK